MQINGLGEFDCGELKLKLFCRHKDMSKVISCSLSPRRLHVNALKNGSFIIFMNT